MNEESQIKKVKKVPVVAVKKPPRLMPQVNKKKTENFAIGVSPSHYWMITALAEGRKSNRMALLEEVIDYFIQNKLSEIK
jgi:hypothetical protein